MRVYEKHPTLDAYRVGGAYVPYAIVAKDKRFTEAEIAAEYWAAALDADLMAPAELVAIVAAVQRFAELPNFDEES
jgi:hypothetical protein